MGLLETLGLRRRQVQPVQPVQPAQPVQPVMKRGLYDRSVIDAREAQANQGLQQPVVVPTPEAPQQPEYDENGVPTNLRRYKNGTSCVKGLRKYNQGTSNVAAESEARVRAIANSDRGNYEAERAAWQKTLGNGKPSPTVVSPMPPSAPDVPNQYTGAVNVSAERAGLPHASYTTPTQGQVRTMDNNMAQRGQPSNPVPTATPTTTAAPTQGTVNGKPYTGPSFSLDRKPNTYAKPADTGSVQTFQLRPNNGADPNYSPYNNNPNGHPGRIVSSSASPVAPQGGIRVASGNATPGTTEIQQLQRWTGAGGGIQTSWGPTGEFRQTLSGGNPALRGVEYRDSNGKVVGSNTFRAGEPTTNGQVFTPPGQDTGGNLTYQEQAKWRNTYKAPTPEPRTIKSPEAFRAYQHSIDRQAFMNGNQGIDTDVAERDSMGLRRGTARVPGPNVNKDVVPAMLTPGEAVLNKGAAEAMGRKKIAALNKKHAGGKKTGLRNGALHATNGAGPDDIDRARKELERSRAIAETNAARAADTQAREARIAVNEATQQANREASRAAIQRGGAPNHSGFVQPEMRGARPVVSGPPTPEQAFVEEQNAKRAAQQPRTAAPPQAAAPRAPYVDPTRAQIVHTGPYADKLNEAEKFLQSRHDAKVNTGPQQPNRVANTLSTNAPGAQSKVIPETRPGVNVSNALGETPAPEAPKAEAPKSAGPKYAAQGAGAMEGGPKIPGSEEPKSRVQQLKEKVGLGRNGPAQPKAPPTESIFKRPVSLKGSGAAMTNAGTMVKDFVHKPGLMNTATAAVPMYTTAVDTLKEDDVNERYSRRFGGMLDPTNTVDLNNNTAENDHPAVAQLKLAARTGLGYAGDLAYNLTPKSLEEYLPTALLESAPGTVRAEQPSGGSQPAASNPAQDVQSIADLPFQQTMDPRIDALEKYKRGFGRASNILGGQTMEGRMLERDGPIADVKTMGNNGIAVVTFANGKKLYTNVGTEGFAGATKDDGWTNTQQYKDAIERNKQMDRFLAVAEANRGQTGRLDLIKHSEDVAQKNRMADAAERRAAAYERMVDGQYGAGGVAGGAKGVNAYAKLHDEGRKVLDRMFTESNRDGNGKVNTHVNNERQLKFIDELYRNEQNIVKQYGMSVDQILANPDLMSRAANEYISRVEPMNQDRPTESFMGFRSEPTNVGNMTGINVRKRRADDAWAHGSNYKGMRGDVKPTWNSVGAMTNFGNMINPFNSPMDDLMAEVDYSEGGRQIVPLKDLYGNDTRRLNDLRNMAIRNGTYDPTKDNW